MPIKIRVAGLLVHAGHVLLAKHRTHPFWILPGGKLEEGESLEDCVERELREETGLRVRAVGPLFLGDFLSRERHVLDLVFRLRLTRATEALPPVACGDDANLEDVRWWPLAEPPRIGPRPLGDFLVETRFAPEAWRYGGRY